MRRVRVGRRCDPSANKFALTRGIAQSELIAVKGKPEFPNLHSQLNYFPVNGVGPATNSFMKWQVR
jgi:hypothetical protein